MDHAYGVSEKPSLYPRSSVPNLQAMDQYWSGPLRNFAAQQEVSLNVMHLNHPKTIPSTLVCGKIVFHKSSPWCQKDWGLLPKII